MAERTKVERLLRPEHFSDYGLSVPLSEFLKHPDGRAIGRDFFKWATFTQEQQKWIKRRTPLFRFETPRLDRILKYIRDVIFFPGEP